MKKNFGFIFIAAVAAILFFSCNNTLFSNVAKIYKVKFSTNGGTAIDEIITNEISEVPYTQKTDCELQGWYTTSDFSGEAVKFPLTIKAETTLYAKWLQKYNVVFNVNGGSEIPSQLTAVVSAAPLSFKENYELEGWYENADFSGGKITFPYTITHPIILHAKWQRTYTASFEVNGGTDIASFNAAKISESPATTKNGFSFAGWYTTQDFSSEVAAFPYTLTSDTTFYAK